MLMTSARPSLGFLYVPPPTSCNESGSSSIDYRRSFSDDTWKNTTNFEFPVTSGRRFYPSYLVDPGYVTAQEMTAYTASPVVHLNLHLFLLDLEIGKKLLVRRKVVY